MYSRTAWLVWQFVHKLNHPHTGIEYDDVEPWSVDNKFCCPSLIVDIDALIPVTKVIGLLPCVRRTQIRSHFPIHHRPDQRLSYCTSHYMSWRLVCVWKYSWFADHEWMIAVYFGDTIGLEETTVQRKREVTLGGFYWNSWMTLLVE